MSRDEMSFGELMDLENRLRAAEAGSADAESIDRALRRVQAHAGAHPAPRSRQWGRPLSMFAVVGIPVAAAVAIAGIVLLNAHPQRALVPTPATTPSPVAAPTSSPSPTASAVAVVDVPCRLPVADADLGLNGPWIRGAFVDYPSGRLTIDPKSEIVPPAGGAGWMSMKNRPILHGDSSVPSYDLAMHQWLPVRFDAISPDGRKYAWVDYSAESRTSPGTSTTEIKQPIHIVDVATGVDRVVHPNDQFDAPTWDSPGAIYVTHHLVGTDSSQGLWRLDPATGMATEVDSRRTLNGWQFIGHNSGWGAGLPIDGTPGKGPSDTVMHLDLSSGEIVQWFARKGKAVQVLGTDGAGHPLISLGAASGEQAGTELWLVTAPGSERLVTRGAANSQWLRASPDREVTWVSGGPDLTGADGLLRVTSDGRQTWVAKTRAAPTGGCH